MFFNGIYLPLEYIMVQYLIFVRYQLLCFVQMKSSTRKYIIIDREKTARNFRREQRSIVPSPHVLIYVHPALTR